MSDSVVSTISIHKRRLPVDQRMAVKALLLETFPEALGAGQLILHYNPGRNALFVEWQERVDTMPQQLREAS